MGIRPGSGRLRSPLSERDDATAPRTRGPRKKLTVHRSSLRHRNLPAIDVEFLRFEDLIFELHGKPEVASVARAKTKRLTLRIPMLLGSARTHCGHTVRLVAFASLPGHSGAGRFTFISLGHVQKFLEEYLREHWDVLCHAQFKDPAFGFEVLLEKARRGQTQDCSWQPRVIRVPTRSEESAVYGQLAQSQKHAM